MIKLDILMKGDVGCVSVKDDKYEIIPLYITAIEELKEDLSNVKNGETKRLIQDEIEKCEKRVEFINNL